MHNGTLRKMALALTFWLALHMSSLKAQIFTNDLPLQAVTTGSNPVDFEFRSDGTMIAKGNFGVGSLGSGDEGAGTRMLWFPSLGAFRAGCITSGGTDWDQSNIGEFSTAFGNDTTASGTYSAAFGLVTTASSWGSMAVGSFTTASGAAAVAMGYVTTASGNYSVSMGRYTTASGAYSMTEGNSTTASGNYSIALGCSNTASGNYSTASGCYTTASSYASFVVGFCNVGGGSPTWWTPTDPLFEIGNGTPSTPSDALVVYKNGNAVLQGTLQISPGGDIPMYTGE